jgi:DNA-binding response OmpR family regulator
MLDIESSPPRVLVCGCGCECPDVLRDALPEANFDVVSCTTPEALLERTLQRAPDLILCQFGGIGGDGMNMLRLIRRMLPETPLVLVSEGTSLEGRRLAQDLRPVYFLLAPWDGEELKEVIGSFLPSASAPSASRRRFPVAAESASNGARPVSRKRRISG